jgi:hypothetical protein
VRSLIAACLSLALLAPAAEGRCAHYSNRARMGTRVGHLHLFSTTLSTAWCFKGRRVTRLAAVHVSPGLTDLGSLLTWEFRGVVGREDRIFAVPGERRGLYRVRRVVHWEQCPGACFHLYVELTSYLFGDGRTVRRNRVRKN